MKKILVLTLAALMVVTLVACASGGSGSNKKVELRVLHYIDMSSAGAAEELDVVWKAFDEAHPNITVNREDEFNDPFHDSVDAYAAAGTLPDVMYCWPSGRSTTLHTQKLLKDLGPLAARDNLSNNYSSIVLDPSQQAGGYMGMLAQGITSTNTFIANKEVLSAVGLTPAKTYSELVAQVPVLKAAGYETILMPNKDTWVMQSCLFSLVAGRFMGEGWEQDILSGARDFNDPDFVAALNFIKTMYDDGVLEQSSLAIDYGDGPGLFSTNKAAYYIDGDWRVGAFITDASTGVALITPDRQTNFEISVFPDIDVPGVKFNRSNSDIVGTGWGINAKLEGDKLEAAWTLVKWLVGKEVQTFRLRTGGISNPSWKGIDFNSLPLEPMQKELANLSSKYDKSTIVIDGPFADVVYTPINDGLQAMGIGTQTAADVAKLTQEALDNWKKTQ
ncbi:MAG: ABC transporter substrate-binding protein [Oscillospiraceae bacterium]|nr:ABC transporter substrate-binding protein [Oscillospiraceae bacterium]